MADLNFMNDQIIGLQDWLGSPLGQYLLAWERRQFDVAVADVFGFHALQLGLPEIDALAANRMPQSIEYWAHLFDGKGEATPQIEWCGGVVETERPNRHKQDYKI